MSASGISAMRLDALAAPPRRHVASQLIGFARRMVGGDDREPQPVRLAVVARGLRAASGVRRSLMRSGIVVSAAAHAFIGLQPRAAIDSVRGFGAEASAR